MNRALLVAYVATALLSLHAPALAQGKKGGEAAEKTAKLLADNPLLRVLASGDAAEALAAVQEIRQAIQADPKKALPQLSKSWAEAMLKAGLNNEAAELALSAIVEYPDSAGIEAMALFRLRALLAAGKGEPALKAAKSYYNIAPLEKTKDAIDLLVQALKLAHPDRPELVYRFKQQQLYAAMPTPATRPAGLGENILEWIAADAELYQPAMDLMNAKPGIRSNLKTLGLLCLLADRNAEALDYFQQVHAMAVSDKEMPDVMGNLARAMKARDRGIGPANAWVGSLRPKTSG